MKQEQEPKPGWVNESGYTRQLALESVGSGWADLVNEVFDRLEQDSHLPIRIVQVKEKYGGLRVYTNIYEEDFDAFLTDIEKRSFKVCELCGKKGALRKGGWYRTLCEEHGEGREIVEPF